VGVDHDPDRIDVYLVDRLDNSRGGGVTHACGTSDAYILLEIEKARHDKGLLAHELGHVFGLRHPGEPPTSGCTNYRAGSFCSVMVPDKPKSFRNTENNVGVIEIPSYPLVALEFQSLGYLAGWNLDAEQGFFHIVRDFPYDDGTEPSQLETPFSDWWSDSDVWNSNKEPSPIDPQALYDDGLLGTPMFNDDHTPLHTEPSCISSNYMYVRLHACQPLAHSVNVDLYLADPGISPGFAQLVPLKPTSVDPTNHRLVFPSSEVRPARPFVKHLEWLWSEVPDGYPTNCCVFAIAHSTHEAAPFADPTAITFADIFPLLGQDNDIAQRNLDIQGCAYGSGASFWSTLPWVQIANPFDQPATASIEIDTSLSPNLQGLSLEVDSKSVQVIEQGQLIQVDIAKDLSPEDRRILRLRAMLPPRAPLSTSFPIDLRFFVNRKLITGYRHLLRIVTLREAVAQVLDRLYGALRSVQAGLQVDTQDLVELVASFIPTAADDPARALGKLCARAATVGNLVANLNEVVHRGPEYQAVHKALARLAHLLEASADSQSPSLLADTVSPNQLAEEIRDLADRIHEPAGRLARLRQSA
jgi:hypothetical protein